MQLLLQREQVPIQSQDWQFNMLGWESPKEETIAWNVSSRARARQRQLTHRNVLQSSHKVCTRESTGFLQNNPSVGTR
jgi:hypothetical protein